MQAKGRVVWRATHYDPTGQGTGATAPGAAKKPGVVVPEQAGEERLGALPKVPAGHLNCVGEVVLQ